MKPRRETRRRIIRRFFACIIFLFVFQSFNKAYILNYVFFTGSNAWFFEDVVLNLIIEDLNRRYNSSKEKKETKADIKSSTAEAEANVDDSGQKDSDDSKKKEDSEEAVNAYLYVKKNGDDDKNKKYVSILNVERNMLYPSLVTVGISDGNDEEGNPKVRKVVYEVHSDILHNCKVILVR